MYVIAWINRILCLSFLEIYDLLILNRNLHETLHRKKILIFDCYGTLLVTAPLYEYIGNISQTNGL